MEIFQICSANRNIREVVVAEPTMHGLKKAAFALLKKPILNILLESSGCKVSSDVVLQHVKNELLMVLSCHEVWTAPIQEVFVKENEMQHETTGNEEDSQRAVDQSAVVAEITKQENTTSQALIEVLIPHHGTETQVVTEEGRFEEDITRIDEAADNEPSNTLIEVLIPDEDSDDIATENVAELDSDAPLPPSTSAEKSEMVSQRTTLSAEPSGSAGKNSELPEVAAKSPKRKLSPPPKLFKKRSSICMKFDNFKINWIKLDDAVNNRLNELDKLARNKEVNFSRSRVMKHDRLFIINMVVDQLRHIDYNISACVMEMAAKQIIDKFNCFQFVDDDGVQDLNRGWLTLKSFLIDRNNYLNRPKRPDQRSVTAKEAKQMRNVHAGTKESYWAQETPDCDATIISTLKRDDPTLLIDEIMIKSIGFIRYIIGQEKSLSQIMSDWPILRRRKLMEFHFLQATGVHLTDLATYFRAKRNNILMYSQNNKKNAKLDEQSSDFEYFSFICDALKENISDICQAKELGTQLDEIRLTPGPGLVSVDLGADQSIYYVFAENARLSEGASSFIVGLQDLFGVLFVHNFMYPKISSKTLDFIQQYLLKIIPKFGSKSRATRVGKQQRIVNRLIDNLSVVGTMNEQ